MSLLVLAVWVGIWLVAPQVSSPGLTGLTAVIIGPALLLDLLMLFAPSRRKETDT